MKSKYRNFSNFTALEILYILLIYAFSLHLQISGNQIICCLYSFTFSGMSCSAIIYEVVFPEQLLSLRKIHSKVLSLFFLCLLSLINNIPFYGCTIIYLINLVFERHLVCFDKHKTLYWYKHPTHWSQQDEPMFNFLSSCYTLLQSACKPLQSSRG